MEELYEKVKAAKDATHVKQAKAGQKHAKKMSAGQTEITDVTEEV